MEDRFCVRDKSKRWVSDRLLRFGVIGLENEGILGFSDYGIKRFKWCSGLWCDWV